MLRLLFLLALLLNGCAAERHYRPIPPGEGPVPQFVQLKEAHSISTVHFPPGRYMLDGEDRGGYYYRAPRPLLKHGFAGRQKYDGGIYLRKGRRPRARAYIVWAGGRTKIGFLRPRDVDFFDDEIR